MTIRDTAGNVLSKTELLAKATQRPAPEAEYTINENIYETYRYGNEAAFESGKRLLFRQGRVVKQSEIDRLYQAAAITTISPASGPAAGGTVITINGSNLGGVEGVTVGGAAATNVQVLSQTQVRATTPAGTAGARDVVVADDSGNVTKTGGYTYV
jgi:hypothetical protein